MDKGMFGCRLNEELIRVTGLPKGFGKTLFGRSISMESIIVYNMSGRSIDNMMSLLLTAVKNV